MRATHVPFLLIGLTLVPAATGCSRCGDERPAAAADAGTASKRRARKDRRHAADGGTAARPPREPRPILPEARLAAIEGQVTVDTTTRVVIPRRRLVDGGVQVEAPDGGPAGVSAGRNGLELLIGDTVRTGADGSVDLELPEEQGTLSVGPSSMVRVSRHAVNEWAIVRGRVRAALQTPGRGRRVLKVATPSALATIVGNEAVIAVADDGALRVYALKGVAKVRPASPREEIEIPEGQMLDVTLEGTAGRPAPVTGDALASADEWRTGKHALVSRDPAAVLRKIAKKMQEDVSGIDPSLTLLKERREKNREILKRSTEARAKRSGDVAAVQQELVENSRTLVEAGDLARGAAMRILLRSELVGAIRQGAGDANLGPGAAQIEGLAERIAAIQSEVDGQFRRFPRRERRERPGERPGRGMPRLPTIRDTAIPRDTAPREPASAQPSD